MVWHWAKRSPLPSRFQSLSIVIDRFQQNC
jgi:hypothetical protein